MKGWAFVVIGDPAPQGSKRHVGNGVMLEQSKKVAPWRESVKASVPLGSLPCLDGPLLCRMVFTLRRPASARKAETVPYRYPDLSKLCRSTEDAITQVGLWADDARVSEYVRLAKVWPGFDPHSLPVPGVAVAAAEVGPGDREALKDLFLGALRFREPDGSGALRSSSWDGEWPDDNPPEVPS